MNEVFKIVFNTRPNQSFHFGNFSYYVETALDDTSNILHSDTLFSSIINLFASIYGEDDTKEVINYFENGNLLVSSGFYELESKGNKIQFYPKPITANLFEVTDVKKLKRIAFVSAGILKNGILPANWFTESCVIIDNEFACTNEEWQTLTNKKSEKFRIYNKQLLTKTKVRKESDDDDSLYTQLNLVFTDNTLSDINTNLFAYIQINDVPEMDINKLRNVIMSLRDEGVGGERNTSGSNFLNVQLEQLAHNMFSGEMYLSLSLTLPVAEDLSNHWYYKIIQRGGRRANIGGRLKYVRMLAEGAIADKIIKGSIVNISPNIDEIILRYGKPFCIPISKAFNPIVNES